MPQRNDGLWGSAMGDVESNSGVGQASALASDEHRTAPAYEEQFTAFIDFLGFSEVSTEADDTRRLNILSLLLSLSALRSEFAIQSAPIESGGTSHRIIPAISTFSDHIVISYPLARISRDVGPNESAVAFFILSGFNRLLKSIAAAALRLGFLIRGGASIGMLYHSRGVVFGEAMIEAFEIESRVAVYPRVVLSPRITSRQAWAAQHEVIVGHDGLHHLDYLTTLILSAAQPGNDYTQRTRAFFGEVINIVSTKLNELRRQGRLKELAKWTWFARELRRGLEGPPSQMLGAFGVSISEIPWPR
jgi:hypothetical protein